MKFSTILIIAGIIIMIVGGIVFMNAFAEAQKKSANANHPLNRMIEKSNQMMKINEPKTNPFLFPLIIIIFGAGLFGVGLYDARRSLGVSK